MSTVGSPECAGSLMPESKAVTGTAFDVALGQPDVSKCEKSQDSSAPSNDDKAPGLNTTMSREDQLVLAHLHSTLTQADHVSLHRGDTLAPHRQPITDAAVTPIPAIIPLSTPPVGVTKSTESASKPVVARMSGNHAGLPVRALPTRPGAKANGPITAFLDAGRPVTSRG